MSEDTRVGLLSGKVAIVTGASRGIGYAIARELARSGAITAKGIRVEEAGAQMVAEAKSTRIGAPQDIAGLVRFVVLPEGRFLQGALIDRDGGQTKTI